MSFPECQRLRHRYFIPTIFVCLGVFLSACGHSTKSFLAKGEEYLQKRKFHDALMQFRSAAESDSTSAKAHWGLARTYEDLGQFNETLDELRKTVELDDSNLEAKSKLGTYFLLVQPPMIAEATKMRDESLAKDPAFIEGHILTASLMAAQGKPDAEVINVVNKAIALDPKRIESYISLERLFTTREKASEAEAAIQKGIAANPASAAGYTEYGRFLMYANRDKEAEIQFRKAIDTDNTSIDAREAIADFFVTSHQKDKAEQAYRDLVQFQENSPESRLELAEFYDKTARKDEAISVLNQILADSPDYVLARYRLCQIYLDRHDIAKVDEQLSVLLKINNLDTEALMLRSRESIQQNKAEAAVKDLEEVLKIQPSGKDPLFLISQARLALGQVDQANAFIADLDRYHPAYLKTGLLKIQSAFTAGDPTSALRLSNELIDKANSAIPNAETDAQALQDLRIRGLSSRGLAYLDLGKLPEAKADLLEIVRQTPNSSSASVNLAKAFLAERNPRGAHELYQRALAADPRSFDAISGTVSTFIQLNQTTQARSMIDDLVAANVGDAEFLAALHYLKSSVLIADHNLAAAENELTMSIGLDENYLPAYSAYASLLANQNRTDEAVVQYQKVVERRPAAQVYTLLGVLEDARGNAADSEKYYRRALEITPDSPIAANNLAWLILDNQGNLDEALQLATGAVNKNPTVAGFYDTLGWVYLRKGLAFPAVQQLKKAVALDEADTQKRGGTSNPAYRVRLGIALAKAGDRVSARREVENSLRFSSELSQRELAEARNILATL